MTMTAPTNAEIDESLFFLEQLARDHHNDGAPETALYINRAATMLRALRDQREADARTCVWSPDDDEYCPGTWDGACGAKWTFTEGGVVDNDMHYCPQCGGKVTVAAMPAQGEK